MTYANQTPDRSIANRTRNGAFPVQAMSKNNESSFFRSLNLDLPTYKAEEIVDETQQAKFWMDINQPERAIDILETRWKYEQPSSPLPWMYLLELYQRVGAKNKYLRLTVPFERIFNGKAAPWVQEQEAAVMHG